MSKTAEEKVEPRWSSGEGFGDEARNNHPNQRGGSLFSQILNIVDLGEFERSVRRTGAEDRTKGFSCWEQFVAMRFCQLAQAKSLREIEEGLACCEGRLRHLEGRSEGVTTVRLTSDKVAAVCPPWRASCDWNIPGKAAAATLRTGKVKLATAVKRVTSVSNGWLAERLQMGSAASVSHYVRRFHLADLGRISEFQRALSNIQS